MSKPITVLERKPVETELVEREYTYEELIELFPDGGESIVNPLVRRCQEYEEEIERLKKDRSRSENELDRLREWVAAVEDGYDKQKAEIERLKKACELYRQASIQSHKGHWGPTRKWGAGCPECDRAAQLRSEAEAALKEEDTHEMA